VKSIKDLGDTTMADGTKVHHYRLIPDKDKLLASFDKAAVKNRRPSGHRAGFEQRHDDGRGLVWEG